MQLPYRLIRQLTTYMMRPGVEEAVVLALLDDAATHRRQMHALHQRLQRVQRLCCTEPQSWGGSVLIYSALEGLYDLIPLGMLRH